jgi:hypothetical protein
LSDQPAQHEALIDRELMTRKYAVFTIVAKNYLARARCLMDSLAQLHPELERFVILADQVDGYFDPTSEPFAVIPSGDLTIPLSKWFHFKYSVPELCTALKPYAIEHLLANFAFDGVLYFDPDIVVYADIGSLLDHLERVSLLVTPHLTEPLDDLFRPSELDILRAGTYNLGFLGVRRTEEALAFVRWWKERLYQHCVVDLPRGLFVDQRWMEFAGSFLEHFGIERDPSYNVAYWNLSQRHISISQGQFCVNGQPLRFFHFSGYDPEDPHCLSKHQNRLYLAEMEAAEELFDQYNRLLRMYGQDECRSWPYAYGTFCNGVSIPDIGRSVHYESPGMIASIPDPFSDAAFNEFVRIWNEPVSEEASGRRKMTRLGYKVYRTQSDLQAAMPDVFHGDYGQFVRWLLSDGKSEHGLPDVFLAPFRAPLSEDASRNPPLSDLPEDALHSTRASHSLPRLALEIYDKRPDLQAFFPDPVGRDRVKYLVWLLSYGKRQYPLPAIVAMTLRTHWLSVLDSLPNSGQRIRYRALLALAMATATVGPWSGRMIRSRLFQALSRSAAQGSPVKARLPASKAASADS